MKRLRAIFLVSSAVALGALAWQVVRESRTTASWLRVEAPRAVSAGRALPLRVTVPAPAPSGLLIAGLHWSGSRHEPRGFLGGSAAQTVTAAGGVFTFEIPVQSRPDLQHVTAVIYLGPTDRWSERTHAAVTDEIPVKAKTADDDPALVPLTVYDDVSDPEIQPANIPLVRGLIALLWAVAAVREWRKARRATPAAGGAAPSWLGRHWLTLACLAAALLEGSDGDLLFSGRLRTLAQAHHFYFERRWVQQIATLGAIGGAAMVAWFALARVKSPARSLALLALGGFAAVSLAELISQHEVDRVFAMEVGPLPLIQVLKLVTAGSALIGVWRSQSAAGDSATGD